MADNNIIFIGMPAVGKSTVGVVIAKRLGYKFVDTDILIQESEGKLLKDIIADVGPDGFLKVEDRVNAQVKAERTVISPGGSVVYCENVMKHYKEIGKVVYLQASFETINSRLKNAKGRGVVLRDGQTLKDLYDERVKLFEKYPKRKRPAIADRFHYSIKLSSSKKLNSSSSKCLGGNLISYCSCANARTSGRLSFSRFFSQDNCSFDSLHGRFKRRFSVISSACFSAGSEAQDLQMWDA